MIDAAFVINLARRPDRLEQISEQWTRVGLPLPLQVFPAVDGAALEELPQAWRRFGPGAYGCYLSHLELLCGLPHLAGTTLVLEDDALLDPAFCDKMITFLPETPVGTDLVLVGYESRGVRLPVSEHLVRPTSWRRTHGYLITPEGRRRAAEALQGRQGHTDRLLATAGLAVYATARPLVGQAAGASDVGGHVRPTPQFWIN